MRILIDTNVVLDVFLDREPFVENAALIWKAHEEKRLTGYVSAITPINVFYIARKLQGRTMALRAVRTLLAAFSVVAVNQSVLESSLALDFQDFEDAVQHASAAAHGLDAIVTRNAEDFIKAQLRVFSPADFIKEHREFFEDLALDPGSNG